MDKESNSFKVLSNLSWISSSIFIERIGTLIFSIIIARLLMPEGFGIYSLAISTAMILITFTDLGVNSALTKYLTKSIQRKNYALAKAYFVYILRIKLVISLLISLTLLVLAYPIANSFYGKPELFWPLFFCGFYILFVTFEGFLRTFFYVYNKLNYFALKEIIYAILRIGLVCAVFLILPKQYQVSAIIIGLTAISFFVLGYYLIVIKKFAPFVFAKQKKIKIARKDVLKFVGYLTLGSISTVVLAYVDTVILGVYIPAEYIGYYRAAFGVVLSISGFLAFSNVLMPFFVRLNGRRLHDALSRSLRYSALLTIPATFGMAALGRYFIVLLFGYDYLPAASALFVLSFLIFESINSPIFSAFYTAKAKLRFYTSMVIISTVLNIVLNFIAVSLFWKISFDYVIIAASIATVISRYVFFFSLYFDMKRNSNLKMPAGSFWKPIISSFAMFSTLYYINFLLEGRMNALIGFIEVLAGIAIYSLWIFILRGISREDYLFLKELIRTRFEI